MSVASERVRAAVRQAFPADDIDAVVGLLTEYGREPHEREGERIQLAIVELSNGDVNTLLYLIGVAKQDYRDILCWQETGPLTPEEGEKLQKAAGGLIERWGTKS